VSYITLEHNAGVVAVRVHAAAQRVRGELSAELRLLSERVAAAMRLASPKFRTLLANSVRFEERSTFEWFVGPHTDYAKWVSKGRKPGRGLPRFFDPAAAQIVAWLEAHPPGGGTFTRPRRGSAAAVRHELELRDRYMALSRYVKARGIKPDTYIEDTAAEFREIVPRDLAAAVHRALEGGAA
jgi:hypothetical protein